MTTAAALKTALIVRVEQIVGGEASCHCGAPAVLVVTTEPDGDPGETCWPHAWDWMSATMQQARRLFGP